MRPSPRAVRQDRRNSNEDLDFRKIFPAGTGRHALTISRA
jgi:hypothetical protein